MNLKVIVVNRNSNNTNILKESGFKFSEMGSLFGNKTRIDLENKTYTHESYRHHPIPNPYNFKGLTLKQFNKILVLNSLGLSPVEIKEIIES